MSESRGRMRTASHQNFIRTSCDSLSATLDFIRIDKIFRAPNINAYQHRFFPKIGSSRKANEGTEVARNFLQSIAVTVGDLQAIT